MKEEIISSEIDMKDYFSASFRDLLGILLDRNENTRATIDQVKSHRFFSKIEWMLVNQHQGLPNAPFVPKINKKVLKVSTRDSLLIK